MVERLRALRRRLVRVEKDVKDIETDLAKFGYEEAAEKAKVMSRLKGLEAELRARHT